MKAILTIYLYKGIIFKSSPPWLLFKSVSCKYAANVQEETHVEMWFQKKLHNTSVWVLYCKFTGDLQNTFLQEQVINNKFCWLVFIIYRAEFLDWSKTFLKVFFISYIFWNNFPSGCCNWSTYYIFILIFSQINLCCNCRSSPPQLFFKNDHLIYSCYKCEEQ